MGDQTQLTTSVVLNSQRESSQGNVLHQGNRPVGAHLEYRESGSLVAVHAGKMVDRKPIMFASFGTHLGSTTVEGQSALEGGVMCVGAARANFIAGDEFQDIRGAQLGNSAVKVEGKMVRLESFGGAEGARASGRLIGNAGGRTRRFGLGTGRSILNWFDPYIHWGEVKVEKRRV